MAYQRVRDGVLTLCFHVAQTISALIRCSAADAFAPELRETHRLTLSRSALGPFVFVSLCHPAQRRVTLNDPCGSLNELGMAV